MIMVIKYILSGMVSDYYLRLATDEFLMIVSKEDPSFYLNVYRKDLPGCTREMLHETAEKMENHPKLEI